MFGAQYLRARMGGGDPTNPAVQAAGLHAYNGGGDPNYVANVFRYRPTLAPSDPNAAVTAYTPPATGAPATTATAQPGVTPPPTQHTLAQGARGARGAHAATSRHRDASWACTAASDRGSPSTARLATGGASARANGRHGYAIAAVPASYAVGTPSGDA